MKSINEVLIEIEELESKELLSCTWNVCPTNFGTGGCFVVTCNVDYTR